MWDNPEYRAIQSATAKARWDNPEYRANQSTKRSDPEFRKRMSAKIKAQRSDPEFLAKQSAAAKANCADPEFQARATAGKVYGSLKKPCRGCGIAPYSFDLGCAACRKRRLHPEIVRLREAG